jgi:ribosomal protein L22
MLSSFKGLALSKASVWQRGPGLRLLSSVQVKGGPENEALVIKASKKNIDQSPWKMNFLVKLVRGKWYPDAMAQLKFSAKPRAVDVGKILDRGAKMAKLHHQAIPEELFVKEIFVTKGFAQKKMRIMGRGRTGFGYNRKAHVNVMLEKINFEKMIEESKTYSQKKKWIARHELVKKIRAEVPEQLTIEDKPAATEPTA